MPITWRLAKLADVDFVSRARAFHTVLVMMRPSGSKQSHIDRTATEPRDSRIHDVTIDRIDQVGDSIRLFRLGIPQGSTIKFLPGQWLDTFVPGIAKPGGFTLASPPSKALLPASAYLELAVQRSSNPPAAWLWDRASVGAALHVRVGGAFVWPPPGLHTPSRVVLVAGGVGVNPLMSIVSHLAEGRYPHDVRFLYSAKAPAGLAAEDILFLERLASVYGQEKVRGRLQLFLTGRNAGGDGVMSCNEMDVPFAARRMHLDDVKEALGPEEERGLAVVYVCGVPSMTDELVERLTSAGGLGLGSRQVLCEKWW